SLINLVLLIVFASTLRTPMPMIERFARLIDSELTPAQQAWCWQWTVVRCAFFFLNGVLAAMIALWAPLLWWTLYTSLIAYIFMGTLFTIERIGRWWKFERITSPTYAAHRSDAPPPEHRV